MDLAAYFERVGFAGEARPDRATLDRLQALHLRAIPYENLDVLLGRRVVTDPRAAFDKLVNRRRGGWCYEMNGAFGLALQAIGFRVTRLASAVLRPLLGESASGNHLVLRVDFDDGPILADVGLGDGPPRPFAVRSGAFMAGDFAYRLEDLGLGWWRLHNREGAQPSDFDFHLELADEDLLSRTCARLSTDPDSIFVQHLICQRFTPQGRVTLLGLGLRRQTGAEIVERTLGSAQELEAVLRDDFGIDEPGAVDLWPRLLERHAAAMDQGD